MTEELKPVRCGCGGEAQIDWVLQPDGVYMTGVYCENCGTKTIPFWSMEKDKAIDYAVTAWNKAMGTDVRTLMKVFAFDATCAVCEKKKERTAKVSKGAYDLMRCECGMPVTSNYDYCPGCGCRLIWGDDDE